MGMLLVGTITWAQNLVPNPSFENITTCPTFASMLDLASPWYNPTQGTPELFHGCAPNGDFAGVPQNYSGGFQYARTGMGFAGIYTFRVGVAQMREYIQVPLLQPLQAGTCYAFKMYVNMPNEFELACDGIGAHISVGPVNSNNPFLLALTPHIDHPAGVLITDTLGWTEVSGTYTATGGETHLTIGNFRNDANTAWAMFNPGTWYTEQAYLLVDDVSLEAIADDLDLGPDTSLCAAGYLLDATLAGATSYLWNDGSTAPQRTVTAPGTYSVVVSAGDCVFMDTVRVDIGLPPTVDLGNDVVLCPGHTANITVLTNTDGDVVWNDGFVGTDRVVDTAGTYHASVTTDCGTASDSVRVVVDECPDGIYLPNAFTPNGDGVNDHFAPVYDARVWSVAYAVHDRWGQQVFAGGDSAEWSAEEMPVGVYAVRLTARSLQGTERQSRNSHVVLVR